LKIRKTKNRWFSFPSEFAFRNPAFLHISSHFSKHDVRISYSFIVSFSYYIRSITLCGMGSLSYGLVTKFSLKSKGYSNYV
jgi:hypothetical protein